MTYRGATLNWYGRQLKTFIKNGTTISMTYDADGLRSTKTVGTRKFEYQYVGDKLYYEKRGDNQEFYYFYDSYGNLSMIYYTLVGSNGSTTRAVYHAVTNAQGDVIALHKQNGQLVARYEYDAWGNTLSVTDANGNAITTWYHIANSNPIRYRGYYYDSDIGLYYLQSRYYDSEIGRFISADNEIAGIGGDIQGYNLYSYCMNNPINMTDGSGNWPSWATKVLIGTAVIAAVAVVAVATAGTGTALACFAAGALKGAITGAIVGAATGAATGAVTHRVTTGSWEGAGQAALEGAADGYMSGAISGAISGGLSSNACFVAGTVVLTAIGYTTIEKIQAGDKVWAENPETGEKGLKTVVRTFENESSELVHIFANGEEIITTPEHPFYVPQKGWTSAIQLRAGDVLVLQNGEYVIIEKIQHEILEEPITVYNFEVEDFHTYYVGESSVLVHNLCYKKFNKANYRSNALKFGNSDGVGVHAHHVYPQKFETFFNNVGINVHSPARTTLLDAGKHLKYSNKYNAMWESFISANPSATHSQVVDFATEASKIFLS